MTTVRSALAAALALFALACVSPAAAPARVALVATGTPELALVDIGSNKVVTRIALPAAGRAVAVSGDGRRGYVAAGATVIALDVNKRTELARRSFGGAPVTALAVSPDRRWLYAVQGRRLRVLRATTLRPLSSIALRAAARPPAHARARRHARRSAGARAR